MSPVCLKTSSDGTFVLDVSDFIYAHSAASGKPWQSLAEHSKNVSALCGAFARPFCSEKMGCLLGVLHDVGKADPRFQEYLKGNGSGCPHAYAGAKALVEVYGPQLGMLPAYVIAGHHTGLPDGAGDATSLDSHMAKEPSPGSVIDTVPDFSSLVPPYVLGNRESLHFWIRMLYSCLVDADWLDTERFMSPELAAGRQSEGTSMRELLRRYEAYMARFASGEQTAVNRIRADILENTLKAADMDKGLFSLTVPTGGGKTLASLGFALRHAVKHGLKKIIYVIPYSTIIEQTADVFERVLGEENVLEHHSDAEWHERETDSKHPSAIKLATENWMGFPVILCTNVQFFESFYSNKSSRCRKLHSVVDSVIILDEAQKLPTQFLYPCANLIRHLVSDYGCSFVFCTATQPDLTAFKLSDVHEIIRDPATLYTQLRRTEALDLGQMEDWEAVAAHMARQSSALCVVNTRRHAVELFEALKKKLTGCDGLFHLSTWMCPQHRRDELYVIRDRLKHSLPTYVVSTSLIEAGVDVDFPVAYREDAGLDSIAQVAGRCNREGRLPHPGMVYVFSLPEKNGFGELRKSVEARHRVQGTLSDMLCHPSAFSLFFNLLFSRLNDLGKSMADALNDVKSIPFKTVAESFVMIDDADQYEVFVPYGEGRELIARAAEKGLDYSLIRRLRRFAVQLRGQDLDRIGQAVFPLKMYDGTETPYRALCPESRLYDARAGIQVLNPEAAPDELIL